MVNQIEHLSNIQKSTYILTETSNYSIKLINYNIHVFTHLLIGISNWSTWKKSGSRGVGGGGAGGLDRHGKSQSYIGP